jgi:hypothetical protein
MMKWKKEQLEAKEDGVNIDLSEDSYNVVLSCLISNCSVRGLPIVALLSCCSHRHRKPLESMEIHRMGRYENRMEPIGIPSKS